ncbi:Hypothetical predicted protein [Octopus vulgaris]|uniref:Uncharacterized protein n=1 Tax=Octopus vulgaris TaxID=6645 RepID=A0AA36F718_OCTVU|nr:Hypothetical predicted protein [Octopus vulgaris]
MKVVFIILLVVLPLAMAAMSQYDEDIDKRFSLSDLVEKLRSLDLSKGCESACSAIAGGFWSFLCPSACDLLVGN